MRMSDHCPAHNFDKCRELTPGRDKIRRERVNLLDALFCPFQIFPHFFGILVALSEPGSRSREALLCQLLQLEKLSMLRIQQSRSTHYQHLFVLISETVGRILTFVPEQPKYDQAEADQKRKQIDLACILAYRRHLQMQSCHTRRLRCQHKMQ